MLQRLSFLRDWRVAGIMLSLGVPTLLSVRSGPAIVFWQEWLAAALLGCALLGWCFDPGRQFQLPRLRQGRLATLAALLFISLLARVCARFGVGAVAYTCLFLIAAGFVAVRSDGRIKDAPEFLAIRYGLLLCAVLQSLAGFAQLLSIRVDGLVLGKLYQQAYGNVGQPNHFADLLCLGVAALPVFWRSGRYLVAILGAAWLGFLIAAAASRASWAYLAVMLLVAVLGMRKEAVGAGREYAQGIFGTTLTVIAIQILFSIFSVGDYFGVTSAIARAADAGSNGQRLYDWSLAVSAIKAHPWLGVGVGGFHGWAIEQMPFTPHVPFSKFAEHAHNLPLHFAATMGLPFTMVFVGAIGWWLVRQLRVPMTPERLFALCGLSVIGLHSMVEYPLWYTYFIIPAGLFCGILTATDPRVRTVEVPAWGMKALGALFVLALVWVGRDYVVVERAYSDWSALRERTPDAERERIRASLGGVANWSIVADHARSLELQLWRPERDSAAGVAQQCEPAFKARPSWGLGTQCLLAMGMAGDRAGVARMSLVLCEGFPRHHQMLREWAEGADRFHPAVSVQSENCLRKS